MPKNDKKTIKERLSERYSINAITGCWLWMAGLNGDGYGYIWTGPNRKADTRAAHRVSWELKFGPIPKGMDLHHRCEHPRCVNPDHLELLTRKAHLRLGRSFAAKNAAMTHCKRGHEFTPSNTRVNKSGSRCCRTCERNRMASVRSNRKRG